MPNPLERFRDDHRAQIEAALHEAEQELGALDARREVLQREIEHARAWLGPDNTRAAGATPPNRLTLHGAMQVVLREHPEGLPVPDLSAQIEERDLYRRRDGLAPGPHQVHARVHNYPQLFRRENGRIFLQEGGDDTPRMEALS